MTIQPVCLYPADTRRSRQKDKARQPACFAGIVKRSLAIFIGGAGQLNGIVESFLEPFIFYASVVYIESKPPLACKINPVVTGKSRCRANHTSIDTTIAFAVLITRPFIG